jgi:nucleoid DNA-binding protein
MAELKTKATDASIDDYISSRASEEQKADCKTLMSMLMRVTKERTKMWGPSMVGFGTYKYTYKSGRTSEMCKTGFAIRGRELVVYLLAEGELQESLLTRLGRPRMGRYCLYFKRLADIDIKVLEQQVIDSLAQPKVRYG